MRCVYRLISKDGVIDLGLDTFMVGAVRSVQANMGTYEPYFLNGPREVELSELVKGVGWRKLDVAAQDALSAPGVQIIFGDFRLLDDDEEIIGELEYFDGSTLTLRCDDPVYVEQLSKSLPSRWHLERA